MNSVESTFCGREEGFFIFFCLAESQLFSRVSMRVFDFVCGGRKNHVAPGDEFQHFYSRFYISFMYRRGGGISDEHKGCFSFSILSRDYMN